MLSQPSRTILAYCELSNIPHEFHLVDLTKGAHLTPEYARINPFQSIPAIVHNNFNVWESGSIISYLADAFRVDNQWYPKDPKVRVRVDSYMHWHHKNTREAISGYVGPKFVRPRFMGAPELTPAEEAPLRSKFLEFFETLKWLISETGYVARTRQASIADVFVYCEIAQTRFIRFSLSPYPEVQSWYDRIGAIPAVVKVHEVLNKTVASLGL
jgi:glutathione S-transferase